MTTSEYDNTCAYCGAYGARTHSGVEECGACWDWRKLDGPMHRYWAERIPHLLEQGPDMHDLRRWQKWGFAEEVMNALGVLSRLGEWSKAAIEAEEARREFTRARRKEGRQINSPGHDFD